jgi:hypothetical protein
VQRLQQGSIGAFLAGTYADGFRALSGSLIEEIEAQRAAERTRNQTLSIGAVIIGVAGAVLLLSARANAWRRDLQAATAARDSLYPLLRRLDDDLPYASGTEDVRRASQAQAEGAERYHRAAELLEELVSIPGARSALPGPHHRQLREARMHLAAAQEQLAYANAILDRAMGVAPGGPR